MKVTFWLPVLAGLLAGGLNAATITFEVTPLGGNNFRYIYGISGIVFQPNQGFDIRFDSTLFAANSLTNATVGSGFTLFLLQPNNPPGTSGDFEAVANMLNPPLTGPFGVNVVFTGVGTPGSQPFTIDTFDANGNITSVIQSGVTSAVPEPSTWITVLLAMIVASAVQLKVKYRAARARVRQ